MEASAKAPSGSAAAWARGPSGRSPAISGATVDGKLICGLINGIGFSALLWAAGIVVLF